RDHGGAMKVCTTKAETRATLSAFRKAGDSIGLVPTMGFLHDGHMALVRAATAECDRVVVSIFVNPTQFGPKEDLASYPRDTDRDLAMLREAGVDVVFMPGPEEMYHAENQTIVETTELSKMLIGQIRPGHFRGVATVVTKLLNIIQPDRAFFGKKDYQQLRVIKTMVRDLDMPVRIIGVPTVREADGLAMSSRNVKLTAEDRKAAVVLSKSLILADKLVTDGITATELEQEVRDVLDAEPRANVQSVDVRDADTLARIKGRIKKPAVVLLAVRFGDVLLIDQRVVTPERSPT
ncbi:MAG: pantoate--beta-alanine ligase, partial [Paracoccaceae bacterium]